MTWYVVDGMDGSGKSTAAGILADKLESEGRTILVIAHPNRATRIGRLELAFLRGDSRLDVILSTLLYIADVLHSLCVMRGRRGRRYDDVIFVRYIMAVAYLPDGLCGRAYRVIERLLPMPDVKVLVDVDPQTAMDRIRGRGEEMEVFETVERLATVRRRMLSLSDGWTVLDNGSGTDDLEEQVRGTLFGGPHEAQRPDASLRFLSAFMFVLLGLTSDDPNVAASSIIVSLLTATVIPVLVVKHYSVRYGNTDGDVAHREDRARPLLGGILSYVAGVVLLYAVGAPDICTVMMLSYALSTVVVMLISTKWKISIHATGVMGPAMALSVAYWPWGLAMFALLPLVMWSRYVRGKHTPLQLVGGAVYGFVATGLVLWAFL